MLHRSTTSKLRGKREDMAANRASPAGPVHVLHSDEVTPLACRNEGHARPSRTASSPDDSLRAPGTARISRACASCARPGGTIARPNKTADSMEPGSAAAHPLPGQRPRHPVSVAWTHSCGELTARVPAGWLSEDGVRDTCAHQPLLQSSYLWGDGAFPHTCWLWAAGGRRPDREQRPARPQIMGRVLVGKNGLRTAILCSTLPFTGTCLPHWEATDVRASHVHRQAIVGQQHLNTRRIMSR